MNTFYKNLTMWLVILLTMVFMFQFLNSPVKPSQSITYSEFWSHVESGDISKVSIQDREITGVGQDGRPFKTIAPDDTELIPMLRQSKVNIAVEKPKEMPWYLSVLISWFPLLLLIGIWIFFMRQMQMGGLLQISDNIVSQCEEWAIPQRIEAIDVMLELSAAQPESFYAVDKHILLRFSQGKGTLQLLFCWDPETENFLSVPS